MRRWTCPTVLALVLWAPPAWTATYYLSPSGSDLSAGTSAAPWHSFAYAINAARAWCGDTLILKSGTYGDDGGTTGKLSINGVACTTGDELTIRAEEQRLAKILDNGTGMGARIENSSYIVLDGLYIRSTNNSAFTSNSYPLYVLGGNNITVRNSVLSNPNKYGNNTVAALYYTQAFTVEDTEFYDFHRHAITVKWTTGGVVRRVYCHERNGRISGGYNASAGLGGADACVSLYPARDVVIENVIAEGAMYLAEVNAEYTAGSGTYKLPSALPTINNKILGSICLGCSFGNGVYLSSRRAGVGGTVQDMTIRDVVFVDHASSANGIRISDCYGSCTFDHLAVYSTGTTASGIVTDNDPDGVDSASNSATLTNIVVTGVLRSGTPSGTGTGLLISGFGTWSGDRIRVNGNEVALNPAQPSNWTNVTTTAPDLGTCKGLWAPDGSNLKGAGTSGSDLGPTILYRYVDGVLTSTKLWDETTGAFPYGENDADNLNRTAGSSLYDVHERLNVNTGGCSFPSGYVTGGGEPEDPATYQSGTGTTSASWSHTIDGGTQGLLVGVALYHAGGNVGSVSSVTGCSGEAISALASGSQVTSPAYRRVSAFGKTSPTSGACTITVSTTGSVDYVVGISIEIPTMGSFGTPATATALSSTPSVTVSSVEDIIDFVAGKCAPASGVCGTTLTAGADQTLEKDTGHATGDVRLAASAQDGGVGGVMSHTMSGSNYWAQVAIPIVPSSPGSPSAAVLTQEEYQICDGYGSESGVVCTTKNTARSVGPEGLVRVRVEIADSVATSTEFGVALYCDRNGGGYAKAMNSFGSNVFRLYGPGPNSSLHPIPESLSALTQKLGGSNFVQGKFIRDINQPYVIPALTSGQRVEVEWQLQLNATAGDTISCRARKDDGTVLDAYTNTATITVRPNAGNAGF